MRLRPRQREPRLDDVFIATTRRLFEAIDQGAALYRRLHGWRAREPLSADERAEAVAAARLLSAHYLFVHRSVMTPWGAEGVMGVWLPPRLFDVTGRLSYALSALGASDPTAQALLTPEELDRALADEELHRWMDGMRVNAGPFRLKAMP
jgi:hypothetical protein